MERTCLNLIADLNARTGAVLKGCNAPTQLPLFGDNAAPQLKALVLWRHAALSLPSVKRKEDRYGIIDSHFPPWGR
jgi:hypothetical protein